MSTIIDIFLHLDVHLASLTLQYGAWVYVILFLIIFAETGLVITPFLPGDSLLFAVGALASIENSGLEIKLLWFLLVSAAVIGDNTNYAIGKWAGPKIFSNENSKILNPKYIQNTHAFYDRHGKKTVLFARFLPIFRTFAPFVAGLGKMAYKHFILFSVVGSILWMTTFLGAGYYFGNISAVKRNFHIVIFGVIGVSMLPAVLAFAKQKLSK